MVCRTVWSYCLDSHYDAIALTPYRFCTIGTDVHTVRKANDVLALLVLKIALALAGPGDPQGSADHTFENCLPKLVLLMII